MKIGIIGTGSIGGTLARQLGASGHDVLVANSRGIPPTVLEEVAFMVVAASVILCVAAQVSDPA